MHRKRMDTSRHSWIVDTASLLISFNLVSISMILVLSTFMVFNKRWKEESCSCNLKAARKKTPHHSWCVCGEGVSRGAV